MEVWGGSKLSIVSLEAAVLLPLLLLVCRMHWADPKKQWENFQKFLVKKFAYPRSGNIFIFFHGF